MVLLDLLLLGLFKQNNYFFKFAEKYAGVFFSSAMFGKRSLAQAMARELGPKVPRILFLIFVKNA